jgi:hypothetical protein
MSKLSLVLERVDAGDKITFYRDFYGGQYVGISRGWPLWPQRRVKLRADEVDQVKHALAKRRQVA